MLFPGKDCSSSSQNSLRVYWFCVCVFGGGGECRGRLSMLRIVSPSLSTLPCVLLPFVQEVALVTLYMCIFKHYKGMQHHSKLPISLALIVFSPHYAMLQSFKEELISNIHKLSLKMERTIQYYVNFTRTMSPLHHSQ